MLPCAGVKSQLINRLLHRRSTIGQAERYIRTATDFVRYRLPELRDKVRQRGLDPTGAHRSLLSSGRASKHDRQADATTACLFPHRGHANCQWKRGSTWGGWHVEHSALVTASPHCEMRWLTGMQKA